MFWTADLNDSGARLMKVRTKTWLPATIGVAAAALGGSAFAQCNSGCAPTPPPVACCTPPPAPPSPPEPPSACCRPPPAPDYPGGGGGGGGNFNLNVNINANANSNSNLNTTLIRAHGVGDLYSGGGGGGGGAYFNVDQPYPTVIQGVNVEGGAMAQVIQTAVNRSRWVASRVVIRAVCIDDRNVPHPASQVQPGRDVAEGYEGELYRCIAGTRLQVTWADYLNEVADFDRGQTLMCGKGESLWYRRAQGGQYAAQAGHVQGGQEQYTAEQYSQMYAEAYAEMYAQQGGMGGPVTVRTEGGPGGGGMMGGGGMVSGGGAPGGGEMVCAAQRPERDCNERSLLRRYGAGIKVLTLWREEFYTEMQEQVVQTAATVSMGSSLSLDGGVGGRVY